MVVIYGSPLRDSTVVVAVELCLSHSSWPVNPEMRDSHDWPSGESDSSALFFALVANVSITTFASRVLERATHFKSLQGCEILLRESTARPMQWATNTVMKDYTMTWF